MQLQGFGDFSSHKDFGKDQGGRVRQMLFLHLRLRQAIIVVNFLCL